MSTERHSPVVSIPAGYFPSLYVKENVCQRVISLPALAIRHSGLGIFTTVLSATVCWWLGYASVSVIDQLVFKSIFVIFGFTMGFRNVRANQRYYDTTKEAASFFAAFWGVYAPLPIEGRRAVRSRLVAAMRECVAHIHRVAANTRCFWYGMAHLEPASEDFESEGAEGIGGLGDVPFYGATSEAQLGDSPGSSQRPELVVKDSPRAHASAAAFHRPSIVWDTESGSGKVRGAISPRMELVFALIDVERQIEPLEPGREQKLKRCFWYHRAQFLGSYDNLLALAFPSVTERFMTFIDICLFMFAASLPWGIRADEIEVHAMGRHFVVSSGITLVVNTTLVVMVMFTLNALTCENENPLSGDKDDIDLKCLAHVAELALDAHERAEEAAMECADGASVEDEAAPRR
mmetsp:Transcript_47540/g.133835  ORF Transcript_47540/g.133835 Transcript_47540/m.133835 type:complete len:405 (-) Transcript_47540:53-1267(-)